MPYRHQSSGGLHDSDDSGAGFPGENASSLHRKSPPRRQPELLPRLARTVDGIQGGTWPQVHLLGTAALERFTGYTGQSRSRHATHTWNVVRLPEIDHGGVIADQRNLGMVVLDALRREPENGFAIHGAPDCLERLLAERAELRALLQQRPPDPRPTFRQTELALAAARKELSSAHRCREQVQKRLDELGPLSQLRRHWREEKAATLERIDAFTNDIHKGEEKISRHQRVLEGLRPDVDRRLEWDEEHGWPDARLRTVDAELAEIERPAHQVPSRAPRY